ncbi:MAG: Rpp14/Pop5 family protein [Candidatus Marsarchaeota archaeon]|nr:Rpp14/Pop5 family protein [Candidatus Marsarchaeota archaeon]MCL5106348.1 Rpp14/Pop5 family protein [Candidatus Marsarchaeota archaeon]
MKQKTRYLLVESGVPILDARQFLSDFHSELLGMIGMEYYKLNLKVMAFISENTFIIRCANNYISLLVVALTFMKRVRSQPTYFYTLKSSGTMLALKKQAAGIIS